MNQLSKRQSASKIRKREKLRDLLNSVWLIELGVYQTKLTPPSQEDLDTYRKEFPERDVPATLAEWESRQRGATP